MASHTDSFNMMRSTKLENEYSRTLASLNLSSLDPPPSVEPSPCLPSKHHRSRNSASICSAKVPGVAKKGTARTMVTGLIDHGIQEVVQSKFVSRILARLDAQRARFKERELTPDEIRELLDQPDVQSSSNVMGMIRDFDHRSVHPESERASVINNSESRFHQKEDDPVVAPPSDLGTSPNSTPAAGSLAPLTGTGLEFPNTTCHGQSNLIPLSAAEFKEPTLAPPRAFSESEATGSWGTETDYSDRPQESSVETRYPDFHAGRPRQVGIATIRIESVSLARIHTNEETCPCDWQDATFFPDAEGGSPGPRDDDSGRGGAEGRNNRSNTVGDTPETARLSGIGGSGKLPARSPPGAEDGHESGEEDDEGSTKPSNKHRSTSSKLNLPRFACPYQAFEPGRSCLRRSSRNPMGGCDGLVRLRQHLARKHMVSYRCPNCWISLDNRTKASLHQQQKQCAARPKPDDERFMVPPHEALIERICSPASEEDAWWWLFKLLVPGMAGRDVTALRMEYSPYFIHLDMALMIPAITFSDSMFHSTQLNPSDPSSPWGMGIMPHTSTNNATAMPEPTLCFPQSNLPMATTTPARYDFSQTFSVPLFETPMLPSSSTNDESSTSSSHLTFPGAMLSSRTSSSSLPGSTTSMAQPAPTTVSPVPQSSPRAFPRETHLRRTNDRFKKRISQLEAENEGLRQASQANRVELSRAHALLEEVLVAEGLDLRGEVYEVLAEVGQLVSGCVSSLGRV